MFSGKFIKKGNKITFASPKDKLAYELYIEQLSEGESVEMYIDLPSKDHSKAQLAKVHACIRELAKESGYTFKEMKKLVKKQAGLCEEGEDCFKSFADCTKDEITLAIQACLEIGEDLNIIFPQ